MASYGFSTSYEIYEDDSLSDDDGKDTSSEDEIDVILHGTPEQRRKLQHLHKKQQEIKEGRHGKQAGDLKADSSSEDEFEKEMNAELNQHVKFLEDCRGKPALDGGCVSQPSVSGTSSQSAMQTSDKKRKQDKPQEEFYDEIYFDSDEEEEAGSSTSTRKQKHSVISNDDLLYDPDMDDEDQKWVDRQRQSHWGHLGKGGKKAKMPDSDALLDCPACMTTLCLDCQRHETYKHQYRAMFVMNCTVDTSETLQCPEQAPKKRKKKKKQTTEGMEVSGQGDAASKDLFNPVRCSECNTVVGVIDHDEVYHFFNVLASYT